MRGACKYVLSVLPQKFEKAVSVLTEALALTPESVRAEVEREKKFRVGDSVEYLIGTGRTGVVKSVFRGETGWLCRVLPNTSKYIETVHQDLLFALRDDAKEGA